jgi:hypothetical protein
MSDTDSRKLIGEIELENLRLIFDRDKAILSDEDYERLASLVEDETDESDTYIDLDPDIGAGG